METKFIVFTVVWFSCLLLFATPVCADYGTANIKSFYWVNAPSHVGDCGNSGWFSVDGYAECHHCINGVTGDIWIDGVWVSTVGTSGSRYLYFPHVGRSVQINEPRFVPAKVELYDGCHCGGDEETIYKWVGCESCKLKGDPCVTNDDCCDPGQRSTPWNQYLKCVDGVCCDCGTTEGNANQNCPVRQEEGNKNDCDNPCKYCNLPTTLGDCTAGDDGPYVRYSKGYTPDTDHEFPPITASSFYAKTGDYTNIGHMDWVFPGDGAWRCCLTPSANVDYNLKCVSSVDGGSGVARSVGVDYRNMLNGVPQPYNDLDMYAVPFVDETNLREWSGYMPYGWRECDYYANGACLNVCGGPLGDKFVLAGELDVGEYQRASTANGGGNPTAPTSNDYGYAECCGDDIIEFYRPYSTITNVWNGQNISTGQRCCDNPEDCIDRFGDCQDGVESMLHDLRTGNVTCADGDDNDCDVVRDWDSGVWSYGSSVNRRHQRGEHGDDGCPVRVKSIEVVEGICP